MKLILNGGGIGNQAKEVRKIINNLIDHNKKILYIPLAWPDQTLKGCLEFMTNELKDIDSLGIEMIKSKEELYNKNFNDYAFIYIGGGNTFQLLSMLKGKIFEKINEYLDNDGIIYGGSAGAIIFGYDLDSCRLDDENIVNLKDIKGFNKLNGYSLLCHYTSRDNEKTLNATNYLLELSKQKPIIAIPEEDTIYVSDDNIEFYGNRPYFIFENGIKKEYNPNKVKEK